MVNLKHLKIKVEPLEESQLIFKDQEDIKLVQKLLHNLQVLKLKVEMETTLSISIESIS